MAVKNLNARFVLEMDGAAGELGDGDALTDNIVGFTPPAFMQDAFTVAAPRVNHLLRGRVQDSNFSIRTNASYRGLGGPERISIEVRRELVTQALDTGAITTKKEIYLLHGELVPESAMGEFANSTSEPGVDTYVYHCLRGLWSVDGAPKRELDKTVEPPVFKIDGVAVFQDI